MTKHYLTGVLFLSLALACSAAAFGQDRARSHVTFTSMHINDCAEIGACYWRLFCGLEGDNGLTLLWEGEADTNHTVAVDRVLEHDLLPPVLVTCEAFEYDDAVTPFDSSVWELIGTTALTLPEGFQEMRIDANRDEGDVTVKIVVEERVHIATPIESRPTPSPPAAPTACRTYGPGVCGSVQINCDRPLPVADDYRVTGVGIAYHAAPDVGSVFVEYLSAGSFTASLCATNRGGSACSNTFTLELGEPVCWHDPTPPPPDCPSGSIPCGGACKTPNQCGIWRSMPR